MEKLAKIPAVTEEDIRNHFARARELIISEQLPEIRQLINLYVDRVVVYKGKVEVYLHMLPGFCVKGMTEGLEVRER